MTQMRMRVGQSFTEYIGTNDLLVKLYEHVLDVRPRSASSSEILVPLQLLPSIQLRRALLPIFQHIVYSSRRDALQLPELHHLIRHPDLRRLVVLDQRF